MKKTLVLYCLFLGIVSSSFSQSSFQVKVSGSGPAILLIPGLASSGEVWNETIAELSKTNECHVLTLAGFAGQPAIDLSAGFLPKMKVDIAEYLEEINKPVTLIGHSLGGFLSLQLANEYPSLISKAVIIDSYPFYSAGMNPAATAEMMVPMAKQTKTMLLNASNEDFEKQQEAGMSMMTATQSRVPQLVDWSMKSDRATFAEVLYELMTTDYRSNLATLNTPTLVLGAWYSAKDYGLTAESVKANFQLQYKFASNVQVEMAPTAYHFIMWDNPEWF
ncbi:MAG: alpha/beta hydrolase, partial [Algoriphagus sp.]